MPLFHWTRRKWFGLVVFLALVVVLLWMWSYYRVADRLAVAQCRTLYARAVSASDSAAVDVRVVVESDKSAGGRLTCGDYRHLDAEH